MRYYIPTTTGQVRKLEEYTFKGEGSRVISPQEIPASNPHFVTDIPELEINALSTPFIATEVPATRGSIDTVNVTRCPPKSGIA
jgi:hypothetical protein